MHVRLTWDRTNGGDGLRYVGSSGDRGRDVEKSMTVDASCNVRAIVTASLGLENVLVQDTSSRGVCTHLAGQPSVKFVFTTRVRSSSSSTMCASSTAGSHSCLSSGVDRTACHALREEVSSAAGTSSTSRKMSSPELAELRWTTTSSTSGIADALAFPFLPDADLSVFVCMRFQSDAGEARSCRKWVSASFRAVYHDWCTLFRR